MRYLSKYLVVLNGILICLCLLTACGMQTPRQDGVSPEENTEIWDIPALEGQSLSYVASFRDGDFDTFFDTTGQELAGDYSKEAFAERWNNAAAKARAYRDVESAAFAECEELGTVTVSSTCARYLLVTQFDYQRNGTVSAVTCWTEPLPVEPEESDSWVEEPIAVGRDLEKQLNGLLTLPRSAEKPPVAILLQGSGANGMDSLIGASDNRPFADLAHGLAERGIAVIRYDKRSYAYPEDVIDIQTEYLWDVKDAVRFAVEDERLDETRLILIGHSQGGYLGPVILTENPEFTGFVSLAGTLRELEDLVLEQAETMMAQDETLPQEVKDAALDSVRTDVAKIKELGPESQASADVLIQGYPETYWKSLNQFDRKALAVQLDVPMLILQGKNDFQVLHETDYTLWQEVLTGRENVDFKAYDGLSHVFMPGSKERFEGAVYDPPAHVDSQVIADIAEWIQQM